MSELSDKIRSEFKKADDERDALMNTPEDIERWIILYMDMMTGKCRGWMYTDRSRHREKTFRSLSAFMEELDVWRQRKVPVLLYESCTARICSCKLYISSGS